MNNSGHLINYEIQMLILILQVLLIIAQYTFTESVTVRNYQKKRFSITICFEHLIRTLLFKAQIYSYDQLDDFQSH